MDDHLQVPSKREVDDYLDGFLTSRVVDITLVEGDEFFKGRVVRQYLMSAHNHTITVHADGLTVDKVSRDRRVSLATVKESHPEFYNNLNTLNGTWLFYDVKVSGAGQPPGWSPLKVQLGHGDDGKSLPTIDGLPWELADRLNEQPHFRDENVVAVYTGLSYPDAVDRSADGYVPVWWIWEKMFGDDGKR